MYIFFDFVAGLVVGYGDIGIVPKAFYGFRWKIQLIPLWGTGQPS